MDDALEEIAAVHSGLGSSVCHVVPAAEEKVGVGFDQSELAIRREPEIEPNVVRQKRRQPT